MIRNLGIILQARMNSSRLRGKVLKKIGNLTLLEHIFCRLNYMKIPAEVVIATSTNIENDDIENFCVANNINVYRGSEHNVLERYYFCAKAYGFDHVVRLTADNPFVDIEELENLIMLYIEEKADYAHSFDYLPKGVGSEIFSFKSLEKSYIEGKEPHHIEHVNEYMIENPNIFKTVKLKTSLNKSKSDVSLTVDTLKDYEKACFIVNRSRETPVSTETAILLANKFEEK